MMITDRQTEANHNRRETNDYRVFLRNMRRENDGEQMIGELVRDGRTIHYVAPVGGKYREGSRADLIAYLMRNRWA